MMNHTYVVIGASGTIGSAVARKLANKGVTLGLHYCRNEVAVSDLSVELSRKGASCVVFQSPLESEEACGELWHQIEMQLGSVSGVALCGGRVPWKAWQELNFSDWQTALAEHCVVPFTLASLASKSMIDNKYGRIVYLSSIAPKYGGSAQSLHYASAKGALEVAMYGLSRNLAECAVGVNGVRSGFVNSPQHQTGRTQREIAERIKKIPMGRPGKPEEVAAAVSFLLSPDSAFITGKIITITGGD